MKYLSPTKTSLLLGLGLLVGANTAAADPGSQTTAAASQPDSNSAIGQIVGSDTLEDIAKAILAAAPAITDDNLGQTGRGVTEYVGLGSSAGVRAMIGGTTTTGEPTCTASGSISSGDTNWGCQEVAPMSRQMATGICDDDTDDPRDPDDSATSNSTAEGLATCLDGISVITDNSSHRQYKDPGQACVVPGADPWLPSSDNSTSIPSTGSGYEFSGKLKGGLAGWKNVLRLIYTGCKSGDGTCASTGALSREQRCGATNTERLNIVNNYGNIFDGELCGTATCTQLRAAYRRDDASGTTTFLLEALGINTAVPTRARPATLGGSGKPGFSAVPENMFCDGGAMEGIWPKAYPTPAGPTTLVVQDIVAGLTFIGDPVQRPCANEDDLCGPDGKIGLVRPIRSPKEGSYPAVQCTRNNWSKRPWPSAGTVPTCPDGTPANGNLCWAPYYFSGGVKNFDCLNPANNRPPSVAGSIAAWDGRVYNFVWRAADATLKPSNTATLPEVAQWRQNMATLNPAGTAALGGAFGSTAALSQQVYAAMGSYAQFTKTFTGGNVCQQGSATTLIGCIVGNTRCTIGFAGREAADRAPGDDNQEAIRLPGTGDGVASVPNDKEIITDHYPLSRSLFVNAIGGFENVGVDCAARGGSVEYCADQVEFIKRFYQMGSAVRNACSDNGFIPITPDATTSGCGGDATCNGDMVKRWTARCVGAVSGEDGTAAAGCGRKNPSSTTLSSGKVLRYQAPARCNPEEGSPESADVGGQCTDLSDASGPNAICG